MNNFVKSALVSIWANKARSTLAVIGVAIGVAAVCVLVSIGQGLKNDVTNLILDLGSNVIAVVGAEVDETNIDQVRPNQAVETSSLTIEDWQAVRELQGLDNAAPMVLVRSAARFGNEVSPSPIIGSTPDFTKALDIVEVERGRMFNDADNRAIVISEKVKSDLFGNEEAIGRYMTISERDFEVIGIFNRPRTTSVFGSDFEQLILVPFSTAVELNGGDAQIFRIVAKAGSGSDVDQVKSKIRETLLARHQQIEDFSVLTQEDIIGFFNQFLSLATSLISSTAAVSLLVGGIGIMNIMMVTVAERTREIGIRKAVGASKAAILTQFLVESIIITFLGGVIGLAAAYGGNYFIGQRTDLHPSLTQTVVIISLSASIGLGLLFGLWPAYLAAKKDPIEALRYE